MKCGAKLGRIQIFWIRFWPNAYSKPKFGNRIQIWIIFVRPAVGLRIILRLEQILEINFINTAGVRRLKCGAKFVRPAGLIRSN